MSDTDATTADPNPGEPNTGEPSPPGALRRIFGSTGQPAKWGVVGHLALGLLIGGTLGTLITPSRGAILAGLTAGAVAAVGAGVPAAISVRIASGTAVAAVIGATLAYATTGHPWWSAAAMALVAMTTSVAAGTGLVGTTLGTIGSFLYVMVAALAKIAELFPAVSVASGRARIVLGAAVGLVIAAISAAIRKRNQAPDPHALDLHAPDPQPPTHIASLWPSMFAAVRAFDESARDGVRRAIPLAIGIVLFERSGSRDALWIFIAAFIVLLPTGKPPLTVALARVLSTIVGVVLLGLLALAVPHGVLFGSAVVLLLVGMAYGSRYPVLGGALSAMGAILLVGAPTGEVGTWATHRVVDTVIGSALALAATYLLWPKDVPDGPAVDSGAVSRVDR